MHSFDAPAHGVIARGVEVMEWSGFCTTCTGVGIVDVTSVGVAVIHIRESFNGIWGCHLGGRRSGREKLRVVALISTSAAAASPIVGGVVVVAWCIGRWRWVHWWACHDCVTHLLEVG